MSTHKGSRSRIQDHDAAREAWERIWGKKDTSEKQKEIRDPFPAFYANLAKLAKYLSDKEKPDKTKPC